MINQLLDGRYRIIETLAAGGFGKTFVAQDTKRPGQPQCVVKMLHGSHNQQTMEIARRLFYKEAETLEKLRHSQIPQLLAFFEQKQEFYLVEEYVPGYTLAQELGAGRVFGEGWVLTFLTDVLQILQFIHNQGVIHRDLKPSNLIRRQGDGNLVLIDFGAVKHLQIEGETPKEASHTVGIGTQGYMPTEQSSGKPRFSSDLYALGMMGIQALTGVHPRDLPEDMDTGEILWQDRANASPELTQILTKMVRYHFSQRYQRAEEVFQDLQPLLAGLPQLAVSPTTAAVNLALRVAEPTYREAQPHTPTTPFEIAPTTPASQVAQDISPTVAADATVPAGNLVGNLTAPASDTDRTEAAPLVTPTVMMPEPAKAKAPQSSTQNPLPWVAGGAVALVVLVTGGWFGWQQLVPKPTPAALTQARTLVTQASQSTAQAKTLEELQTAKAQWQKVLGELDAISNPGSAASEIAQIKAQSQQEITQLETRIKDCSAVLWGNCP
ncbi:serine/threonine protein kinase [Gloeomargarita lithophora Alchichica-D10]|uniref:non-specific serine/threonine protein kinase n=1 Tax=Gloeomargarita lithophora Alchichica-D10 TaxID=1188229 RepID=A0A1J0AAB2_9CYAN|nr:protein kinase [Gloeomargarita lithophora]APB32870.1 serine/threonine protein kinase [Gloeomargarita lithophora Alchichica-D10]